MDTSLDRVLLHSDAVYNRRLITTRWAAGALLLGATLVGVHGFNWPLPEPALLGLGGLLLLSNLSCVMVTQRGGIAIRQLLWFQIGVDALALLALVHLTGGVTSPALPLFALHGLMVAILLPDRWPYGYVAAVMSAVLVLALVEAAGILTHYRVIPETFSAFDTPAVIAAHLVLLALVLVSSVVIARSIVIPLQQRERQLAALYEFTRVVSARLDRDQVLQTLITQTQQVLASAQAAVYLPDADRQQLTLAASSTDAPFDPIIRLNEMPLFQRAFNGDLVTEPETCTALIPLIGDQTLGVLVLRSFTLSEVYSEAVVRALAQSAAVALKHANAHHSLLAAEQQRTQFVHVVTHELRSPVTGAQSLLNVMLRNLVGEVTPAQRDVLERVARRLDSLLTLINELLALASVRVLETRDPLEAVDVENTLRAILDTLRPQITEKHLELLTTWANRSVCVMATPDGLTRIFENLTSNAVKYTPENGSLSVRVYVVKAQVEVWIADTGIGIPAEALSQLGQEFFRASNARSSGIVGTGLGLAIVYQLVEKFGGQIRVHSEVGRGTTFKLTFPIAG